MFETTLILGWVVTGIFTLFIFVMAYLLYSSRDKPVSTKQKEPKLNPKNAAPTPQSISSKKRSSLVLEKKNKQKVSLNDASARIFDQQSTTSQEDVFNEPVPEIPKEISNGLSLPPKITVSNKTHSTPVLPQIPNVSQQKPTFPTLPKLPPIPPRS